MDLEQEISTQQGSQPSILNLPPHILEKILKYVTKDWKMLSLVCKKFYEIICGIYEEKLWFQLKSYDIIIKDERLEKLKCFTFPMENCKLRPLRNIKLSYMQEVTTEDYEEFWEFLEIQGKFVKKVTVEGQIKVEVFGKIIEKVKNLRELSLEKLEMQPENYTELNLCGLKNLEKLTVDACDNFDLKNLNLNENSLKFFKYNASYCVENLSENLEKFLGNQKELRTAIFPKPYTGLKKLQQNFLKTCQLEKLEWNEFYENNENSRKIVEEIFNQQAELKDLKFYVPIWGKFFEILVKNGKYLENFCGNFSEIKNFDKISKLTNLKNFEVINGNFDEFFSENTANCFKKSKIENEMKNLTSLTLKNCKFSNFSTPKNLSKFLPNLKVLKCESFSAQNLKFDFNEIFANFPRLENLIFYEFCDMFREDSYKLQNEKIRKNENLKILKIHFPLNFDFSNFECLTSNFPNLEDLEIFIHNKEQKSFKNELEIIFKKFVKLQKIFITFAFTSKFDFEIFDLIKTKQNLKFFYLENVGFSDSKLKENVKILGDQFEEIEILAEREYGIENCYVISIAKNHSIYNSKIDSIQDYIEVSTHDDRRFFL